MAISYNTGATATADTATSCNITIPAGVLTNDVMVMSLCVFTESSSAPTISFSGAGGTWTPTAGTQATNNGTVYTYGYAYYRVATAGDPGATLTVTESGSAAGTTWFSISLVAYTGANLSTPVDVSAGNSVAATTTTSIVTPTQTTGAANDWALQMLAAGTGANVTLTVPSGTQRQEICSDAGITTCIVDSNGPLAANTSIGGGTFNASNEVASSCWLTSFTIGIQPPASFVAAVFYPLHRPARAAWPAPFSRGRAYTRRGALPNNPAPLPPTSAMRNIPAITAVRAGWQGAQHSR